MGAWSWFASDSTEDFVEPWSDALDAPAFPVSAGAVAAGAAEAGAAEAGAPAAGAPAAGAAVLFSLLVAVSPGFAASGTSPSREFGTWFAVLPVASSGVAGVGVP
ncbi:hypothetical protein DEJ33_07915 [Curtobacterium sp. MCPF17_047]|nr:hypothetical protein DEJ24_05495 [Curtobacterium sp. MCPF17_001]PZF66633.1 hypothetical protein DEJ33_07915 [Curtobacterium sp. MCPF17_047]